PSAGATTLTMIDHATLSLQNLVNGIRSGFFEAGHLAHNWVLQKTWTPEPEDPNLVNFDEEWNWLSDFGAWRAALLIYLYPENGLFPDLRSETSSSPYPMSLEFKDLLDDLRSSSLTPTDITGIFNRLTN